MLALYVLMVAAVISFTYGKDKNDCFKQGPWIKSDECGQSLHDHDKRGIRRALPIQKRIVGGNEARPHQYPWQVSLLLGVNEAVCGGTLISPCWVVTAGHCLQVVSHPSDMKVYVGAHAYKGGRAYTASQIVHHPDYSAGTRISEYDIGLVRLCQPVSEMETVLPVCPPDPGELYTWQEAVASGWGDAQIDNFPHVTPFLMSVELNISTNDYCKRFWDIEEYHMCTTDNADGKMRDTCLGDSGGPLVVKQDGGSYVLAGITSYGSGRCADGFPGVYTRVTYFLDWIQSVVGQECCPYEC